MLGGGGITGAAVPPVALGWGEAVAPSDAEAEALGAGAQAAPAPACWARRSALLSSWLALDGSSLAISTAAITTNRAAPITTALRRRDRRGTAVVSGSMPGSFAGRSHAASSGLVVVLGWVSQVFKAGNSSLSQQLGCRPGRRARLAVHGPSAGEYEANPDYRPGSPAGPWNERYLPLLL